MIPNSLPWERIYKSVRTTGVVLFAAYFVFHLASLIDSDTIRQNTYQSLGNEIKKFATYVFEFAKPFIEVILAVLLLDWILKKWNINARLPAFSEWKIFHIIVILSVGSFVFAALRGMTGAPYLQDLALIVIGYYFGTLNNNKLNV